MKGFLFLPLLVTAAAAVRRRVLSHRAQRRPPAVPGKAAAPAPALIAHVGRKLQAHLGGQEAADAVAARVRDYLVAVAGRVRGPCPSAVALAVDEAGRVQHAADVNQRLADLCRVVCSFLATSPPDLSAVSMLASADDDGSVERFLEEVVTNATRRKTAAASMYVAIDGQHRALRERIATPDRAAGDDWFEVAREPTSLRSYADAATQMGEREWVQACFEWCAAQSRTFFFDDGWRRAARRPHRAPAWHERTAPLAPEAARCLEARLGPDAAPPVHPRRPLKVCDVGSCYNPFAQPRYAALFDVVALDLWPARPEVLRCDFLNVTVRDAPGAVGVADFTADDGTAMQAADWLGAGAFDVVIMSLVLSYLPQPLQRAQMVANARRILRKPSREHPCQGGLLLLADPISVAKPSPASPRADRVLSAWIDAVEAAGFRYVRYDLVARRAHALAFQTMPDEQGDRPLIPMPVRKEVVHREPGGVVGQPLDRWAAILDLAET